jgi:hypothetical protein
MIYDSKIVCSQSFKAKGRVLDLVLEKPKVQGILPRSVHFAAAIQIKSRSFLQVGDRLRDVFIKAVPHTQTEHNARLLKQFQSVGDGAFESLIAFP